jgi:outer membrane immunogenic protein
MRRWSIAALAAVSSIAITQIASAADLPVREPVYRAPAAVVASSWSGFYVGGHVGYFWGRTRAEEDGEVIEPGAKTNGVIGGVLAGVNWQTGPVVLGLEGDIGWTNAHGTGRILPVFVTTQEPNQYDLRWTSHVRGRAGYAAGNWLFFAAGGLAIADLDFREGAITTTCVANCTQIGAGGKYFGWSVGGGIDYAFTRNIIGRIEYLYDDFGHKDYIGADGDPYRISLTGHTARGALMWKF